MSDRDFRNPERFPGADVIGIVGNADRVQSYKIKGGKGEEGTTIASYPIVETGRDMAAGEVETLKTLLIDERSYCFGPAKKCLFLPEYAFRITGGDREAVLLVCFSCEQLVFVYGGREILADFDPVSARMKDLSGEVFTV